MDVLILESCLASVTMRLWKTLIDRFNLVLRELLTLVSAAVSAIGEYDGQQMQGRATVFVWTIAV
jgi:hypothetical protein